MCARGGGGGGGSQKTRFPRERFTGFDRICTAGRTEVDSGSDRISVVVPVEVETRLRVGQNVCGPEMSRVRQSMSRVRQSSASAAREGVTIKKSVLRRHSLDLKRSPCNPSPAVSLLCARLRLAVWSAVQLCSSTGPRLNENEERAKVSLQNPLVSPYLRAVFPPHPMCPRCDASGAAGQPIQRPGGDECAGSSTIYICIGRT